MFNLFRRKTNRSVRKDEEAKKYIDCYETIKVLVTYVQPVYLCDVGASDGSWAYTLSLLDPKLSHVVSFEPRKDAYNALHKRKISGVMKIDYPFGLGNKISKKYIRGGTTSASFFEEKDQQLIFPESLKEDKEQAEIYRLDDIYKKDKLHAPDTIKLDVQGYEQYVLEGGTKVLTQAKYLVTELSFREFYRGQPALSKTLKLLEKNDFELVDFGFQWRGAAGDLVQADGIFRNKKFNKYV